VATVDAHLIALTPRRAKVVWDTTVDNYKNGYYFTLAPLIAKGKVMVGTVGRRARHRGYIAAFDADDGKPVWRPTAFPARASRRSRDVADRRVEDGRSLGMLTAHYDPQLNLSFWGTGQCRAMARRHAPGDNLYASSGDRTRRRHRQDPRPSPVSLERFVDWDEGVDAALIDFRRTGGRSRASCTLAATGNLWRLERSANGITFIDARPFVTPGSLHEDRSRHRTAELRSGAQARAAAAVTSVPGSGVGKDWTPQATTPDELLVLPANENQCSTLVGKRSRTNRQVLRRR